MRTDPSVNSGQPFYYQEDHEGSVTHLTNGSGAVIESYRYDAFGKPTINGNSSITSSPLGNRFMFTGREYISQFGIYEYRARTYNPTIGRFMSEDPKGFDAGDCNLFRYCHNDPEDLTDPMGLATAPDNSPYEMDHTPDQEARRNRVKQEQTAALKRMALDAQKRRLAQQKTRVGVWQQVTVNHQDPPIYGHDQNGNPNTPVQAETHSEMDRPDAERGNDGKLSVTVRISSTVTLPNGASKTLTDEEMTRSGRIDSEWIHGAAVPIISSLEKTQFKNATDAENRIDAALRRSFDNFMAHLKFDVDNKPAGQPQL